MLGFVTSWLEARREKRAIRAAFGQFLSPDTVQQVLARRDLLELSPPRLVPIHFVIAQAHEAEFEAIGSHVGRIVEVMISEQMMVDTIFSSMVIGVLGWPFEENAKAVTSEDCARAADAVVRELGSNVRVVYGHVSGHMGNTGSKLRISYGATLPDLSGALRSLLATEFGTAMSFPSSAAGNAPAT